MQQKKTRDKEIPKKKLKAVENIVKLLEENRSFVIVSIKNLPTSQFQLIKKKLRGNAELLVANKNIIIRAIDKIEKGTIKNFKKYIKEDTALIFSKLEPFELSSMLSKNKSMSRAKIGQIVEQDIEIEPGPTELVPGPVISELGVLGIKFSIEDGKINIRERKIILKAGEAVKEQQASIMSKLDMKPIKIGLEPLVAYDAKEDKIYENIKVDSEKVLEDIKYASGKALAFAVKLAYPCKETIIYLLGKANAEYNKLSSFVKEEK